MSPSPGSSDSLQGATDLARRITGFAPSPGVATSEHSVSLARDQTPFLAPRIRALGEAREVRFTGVSLTLPSAVEGFLDPYRRTFRVRLAGTTFLGLDSDAGVRDADLLPRPTGVVAEIDLAEGEETYLDFPPTPPALTFLDALDRVLAGGVGCPMLAKEIDGLYVVHAQPGELPRPAWVVEMRGLPPYPIKGPEGADPLSVPRWQRNHLRNVVDATTGQVLFADNVPHPDAPKRQEKLLAERFQGDAVLLSVRRGDHLLRRGRSGEAVRKVQSALIDLGHTLPRFGADGKFGGETEGAVRAFQGRQRLLDPDFLVDGIVGPQTLGRMDRILAATWPLPASLAQPLTRPLA